MTGWFGGVAFERGLFRPGRHRSAGRCRASGNPPFESLWPADGYVSAVTLAEVHDVVRAIDGRDRADAVVDGIAETGIRRVDTDKTWLAAADAKHRYSPALGDAFALATAERVDGTLLVGAADDYDGVEDVPIARFRTELA